MASPGKQLINAIYENDIRKITSILERHSSRIPMATLYAAADTALTEIDDDHNSEMINDLIYEYIDAKKKKTET